MQKIFITIIFSYFCSFVYAQNIEQIIPNYLHHNPEKERSGLSDHPTLEALQLGSDNEIKLDGSLDEKSWKDAALATGFTQREPKDGAPATEKTEVRILYSRDALYVGIIAYDSAPDSVIASLFRRDGTTTSDWVYINIDSYNDKRTAFTFAVNPRGVQKDILYYNDTGEDKLWDAVWEVKTRIIAEGWSAELKIPFSQLRFSAKNELQSWGINFQRKIARKNELSYWAPTSQKVSGIVSKFGTLSGLKDIDEPKRLELIPYISASTTHAPITSKADPYYNEYDMNGNIGGDIKYGLTSDFTLTATINPDFGQVEADPATINLSAYETYFSERRPFFLEGSDIFSFGGVRTYNWWGNPETFYSRRIGRKPQGNLMAYNKHNGNSDFNPDSVQTIFTNDPEQTTIASAVKISGKTKSGWSIGVLDAYTVKETARYEVSQGDVLGKKKDKYTVEPATNYFVSRTKKDIDNGNTVFGSFFSATNRNIDDSYFETYLNKSAYLGGVDFEHKWHNKDWTVSGVFSVSQINGSEEAILLAQYSSARYYNRVDSDYLSVDSTKTSLSGYASALSIKKSGGHYRGSLTYSGTHPGYEANDLGYQNRGDYHSLSGSFTYVESNPKKLRYYEYWTNMSWGINYDGDLIGNNYNMGGYWEFKNQYTLNANVNYSAKQYQDRLTRGGPVALYPESINFNMNANTNYAKKVASYVGTSHRWDKEDEFDHYYWFGITLRPTTFIQVEIEPEIGFEKDIDQFITTHYDPYAVKTYNNRYVFSTINTGYFTTAIRLDWTFKTNMSLQTYFNPYILVGDYNTFKEFKTPRKIDFMVYGEEGSTITENDGMYTVDPDGTGLAEVFSFSKQDFNYKSLQGNVVFRWEYNPGSTLFLVWQHQRDHSTADHNFNFANEINGLFEGKPTDIFLVKLSYWFGS